MLGDRLRNLTRRLFGQHWWIETPRHYIGPLSYLQAKRWALDCSLPVRGIIWSRSIPGTELECNPEDQERVTP